MKVLYEENRVTVRGAAHFDLTETLECGQCFRFHKDDDELWKGIARGKLISLRPLEDGMILENCSQDDFDKIWRVYFDLDRDYEAIRSSFMQDPQMKMCAEYAPGIRILQQEPWEALISFIISANNNVHRIKGIVERLCSRFGEEIEGGYAFPEPERLAPLKEEDLAALKAGWRAAYILDAARRVCDGRLELEKIKALPIEDARKELMSVKGVGPKVAECVLLYGMGKLEAFPMDVWMKRAMTSLFPGKKPENFGEFAGIAQQYIFHYSRMEKIS